MFFRLLSCLAPWPVHRTAPRQEAEPAVRTRAVRFPAVGQAALAPEARAVAARLIAAASPRVAGLDLGERNRQAELRQGRAVARPAAGELAAGVGAPARWAEPPAVETRDRPAPVPEALADRRARVTAAPIRADRRARVTAALARVVARPMADREARAAERAAHPEDRAVARPARAAAAAPTPARPAPASSFRSEIRSRTVLVRATTPATARACSNWPLLPTRTSRSLDR
jgi:hypothetical protein